MHLMDRVGRLIDWLCYGRITVTVLDSEPVSHVTYGIPRAFSETPTPRPRLPLLVTDPGNLNGLLSAGSWLLDLPSGRGGRTLRDHTHHLTGDALAHLDPAEWSETPCIVLDERAALTAVAAQLPRHRNLVVVASSPDAYPAAVQLTDGAATVITLPANAGWLLSHLTEPAAPFPITESDSASECHTEGSHDTCPL
jgi:hypothetical protein